MNDIKNRNFNISEPNFQGKIPQKPPRLDNYYDKENIGGHRKNSDFQSAGEKYRLSMDQGQGSETFIARRTSRDTEYEKVVNDYDMNEYASSQGGNQNENS